MTTFTETKTSNGETGIYSEAKSATETYATSETGTAAAPTFSLTLHGSNVFQSTDTGNTILGTSTQTQTGTDTYSMGETGVNGGKKFSQTITGTDVYNFAETSNTQTGTFSLTESGTDTYDLKEKGGGNVKPRPAPHGTLTYNDTETGNTKAGSFNLTKTGEDRYGLLDFFIDASNTGNGYTPGNLEFHPFGATFTDVGGTLNHCYPLYLGGSPYQLLVDLPSVEAHNEFHRYFSERNLGFGEAGRAEWAKLSLEKQTGISKAP